jgi:hypothetical protein
LSNGQNTGLPASSASSPPSEFSEGLYLKANPDVADAVARGAFSSGLEHWLLYGRAEGRMVWTKADIINFLAEVRPYRRYLEICTPTSGGRYVEIDRSKYQTCHRLMYQCPIGFSDGNNIDFRSPDLKLDDCIQQIHAKNLQYDVVFVDAFHEYETSLRDLRIAVGLIDEGGAVVVHDCNPPSEDVACPHFIPSAWAGVTYKSYLDFVISREDLVYVTVDTDWGCGVIRRSDATQTTKRDNHPVIEGWRRLGDDFHSAFHFLQANKKSLLNFVSLGEFLRGEGAARAL